MSRRYLTYRLWAAGHLAGHVPSFADVSFWLAEGAPPAGRVEVEVTHEHVHHGRR